MLCTALLLTLATRAESSTIQFSAACALRVAAIFVGYESRALGWGDNRSMPGQVYFGGIGDLVGTREYSMTDHGCIVTEAYTRI